jgi:predicted DsbA family dithiol-disulfide isomerase
MQIDIWSDIYCPWCYIGKRRLEQALAHFEHRDKVEIEWRSFQLDPRAPAEYSGTANELLMERYGRSETEAQAMHDRVTALAAAEGLEYRFDRVRPGNSFLAHRLQKLAASCGLGEVMQERLFRAYFNEGLSLADPETLLRLGGEVGLAQEDLRQMLAGDAWAAEVRADIRDAARLGIHGVPFFVFDRKYAVSGAQPAELFLTALERAWAERDSGQQAL